MKQFRQHAGNSACSAYILLEVMRATAIFAMAAVALAVLLNETMDASVAMRKESDIVWNLESKMAGARIKRLVAGKQTLPADDGGIIYDQEISPLDLKNSKNQFLSGLYNIKITARWKQGDREEQEVAQTYVYQP